MATTRDEARAYRKQRVRRKISGTALRPRLAVYRSLKHLHVQIVDDATGTTLVAASTTEKALRVKPEAGDVAQRIGAAVAERALQKNIKLVVFDRGSFLYHGRVKAIADAARAGGLQF